MKEDNNIETYLAGGKHIAMQTGKDDGIYWLYLSPDRNEFRLKMKAGRPTRVRSLSLTTLTSWLTIPRSPAEN